MTGETTHDAENEVGMVTGQLEAASTTLQCICFQRSKDWKWHKKKAACRDERYKSRDQYYKKAPPSARLFYKAFLLISIRA